MLFCRYLSFPTFTLPSWDSFTSSAEAVNQTAYDYIIVGGGLSDPVITARLTEDPTGMM